VKDLSTAKSTAKGWPGLREVVPQEVTLELMSENRKHWALPNQMWQSWPCCRVRMGTGGVGGEEEMEMEEEEMEEGGGGDGGGRRS
jgi:hypothetical protein